MTFALTMMMVCAILAHAFIVNEAIREQTQAQVAIVDAFLKALHAYKQEKADGSADSH